jgi:hypothetical protein
MSTLTKGPLDYCINWLRTKARFDRYDKEFRTVKAEMCWTLLYFETQWETWVNRASESDGLGHKAYALKQAAMWERFGMEALKIFQKLK